MELPQETLGLLLIRAGSVTRGQLYEGLRRQKLTGERIGEALIALGLTDAAAVSHALAEQLQTPLIDTEVACGLAAAHREDVPADFVNQTGAVPIGRKADQQLFVVAGRAAIAALESTTLLPNTSFGVYLVADACFEQVLAAHHGLPDNGKPADEPALDAPSMTFHEALERLYDVSDLGGLAETAGIAAHNFFNRIAVILIEGQEVSLRASFGFTPDVQLDLRQDEAWLSPTVWYGELEKGPDHGHLAKELGSDPSQKGLVWLVGDLPSRGFAIYGDHAGTDTSYDDLKDLEGLFNEVKTALELLNNPAG